MSLTTFLQESFIAQAPSGWRCSSERRLLTPEIERELGFSPRVDVVLEHPELNKRIWIEFEISRADPAANHIKYAVGHFFSPAFATDTFLSMVSNHVAQGRANLGASTVLLMRHLGISAFQTPLLPHMNAATIKELNHLPATELQDRFIDVAQELQRALAVTAPACSLNDEEVYYAANSFEVSMNVKQWNADMAREHTAKLWGQRTVKYFVYDHTSTLFAPSKFCAFLPIARRINASTRPIQSRFSPMTLGHYCALDQSALRFDGGNAQRHLRVRLGYDARHLSAFSEQARFQEWLSLNSNRVRAHPEGPVILSPNAVR